MFGHWPCLPLKFYFLMIRGMKKHQCVYHYIAELCEWLWEALKEAQVQFIRDRETEVVLW